MGWSIKYTRKQLADRRREVKQSVWLLLTYSFFFDVDTKVTRKLILRFSFGNLSKGRHEMKTEDK